LPNNNIQNSSFLWTAAFSGQQLFLHSQSKTASRQPTMLAAKDVELHEESFALSVPCRSASAFAPCAVTCRSVIFSGLVA
jgi:hypothetical protein